MDYLSLSQVLEKLKNIPKPCQPQSIAQLAHACMEDKITPVFSYDAYALEYACGTGEDTEYIIIPVKGCLTNKNITNVFNWTSQRKKKIEITEAQIYELAQQEQFLYKGKSIVLARTTFNHLRPFGNAKSVTFDTNLTGQTKLYSSSNEKDAERIRNLGGIEISQDDLLFSKTQIEDYIDSFICENEESYIDPLIFNNSDNNAKIESQKQEIDLLKANIIQLTADNNDLQKRLKQQVDKPANDNIEQDHLYNWQAMDKNQYPPELHLAIEIWKEYYQVDVIKHISHFDAGRFNRIANDFNLRKGNLKIRIRRLLTPLNSKTKSPELLSSLEVINIIHNDKLEQD